MKNGEKCDLGRRKLIISAGALASGAAVLSSNVANFASTAQARETTVYPYKQLDIPEVGRIAHETYYTKFCAEAVITGIFRPLTRSVGAPYDSFPLHSLFWAHGGMMGWGTGCGTLIGAGMAVSLITGASKEGEAIINDVITYYSNTELPIYKPEPGKTRATIHNTSMANTPICHISVGKWMKKENVSFFTIERNERCARLSADVAIYTAQLLNEWSGGEYKSRNKPLSNVMDNKLPSQTNCNDCHGNHVPGPPGVQ